MKTLYLKRFVLILGAASAALAYQGAKEPDAAHWKQEAARVTIIRDDWGIAHVHGKTDADAVFGMEYAQAEDDFNRVDARAREQAPLAHEIQAYIDRNFREPITTSSIARDFRRSADYLERVFRRASRHIHPRSGASQADCRCAGHAAHGRPQEHQ